MQSLLHVRLRLSYGFIRQISSEYTSSHHSEMLRQRPYMHCHWLGNYEEISYLFPAEQVSQQTAHPVTDCVESNKLQSRFRAGYWNRRIIRKSYTSSNCFCLGTTDFLNLFKSNSMCFPSALQLKVLD